MTKEKQFKPVFLFKENEHIRAKLGVMEGGILALKSFIQLVEGTIKMQLTNEEKTQLRDKGTDFIKESLKEKFPFREASEDFNLEALGMRDLEISKNYYKLNSQKWQPYNFQLNEDGIFQITESDREKVNETFSYYTTNEKQNESLKIAESLVKLFDEAEQLGLVNYFGIKYISNICKSLAVDMHPVHKEQRIMVNKRYLRSVNSI